MERSHLDLGSWHQYQGSGTNDCGAYCVAMVANALGGLQEFEGSRVARSMERLPWVDKVGAHFALYKVPGWASFPWGISACLRSLGLPARLVWPSSRERLVRGLRDETVNIVIVGDLLCFKGMMYKGWAHAKVLYGYQPPAPTGSTLTPVLRPGWYFVDPAVPPDSSGELPAGLSWQDEEGFSRQWGNLLRCSIEIRKGSC